MPFKWTAQHSAAVFTAALFGHLITIVPNSTLATGTISARPKYAGIHFHITDIFDTVCFVAPCMRSNIECLPNLYSLNI